MRRLTVQRGSSFHCRPRRRHRPRRRRRPRRPVNMIPFRRVPGYRAASAASADRRSLRFEALRIADEVHRGQGSPIVANGSLRALIGGRGSWLEGCVTLARTYVVRQV